MLLSGSIKEDNATLNDRTLANYYQHQSTVSLMGRLTREYIRPYVGRIALAIFFMFIVAAAQGMSAWLMKPIIDDVFIAKDRDMLKLVSLAVLATFTIKGFANYAQILLMNWVGMRIIADAQNARAADKLATIEISIGLVARRVVQLMQQYMTGEQMAQVSAAGGERLFVPYSRDDIVGEYDFSVEGGSTQPMNETIRKQQAVSLMNAVAPLVGIVIDPAALAKYVLQTGFGIKNPEKFIMQPQEQTPQDAEAAQAEAGAAPMPFGQAPIPQGPDMGAFAPTGGVPPELLAQLQGQMGLELPQL